MKIAIIGATGFIGSALLQEAFFRNLEVTAIAARPEKLPAHPLLITRKTDVQDLTELTAALKNVDVVIAAFSGHGSKDVLAYYMAGIKNIVSAAKESGVKRVMVVGGAGSLEVAPGVQVLDTPEFPQSYRATAEGARQALELLRNQGALQWTVLSPAAQIAPGVRTAKFRLGGDQLLVDADGKSSISLEDYAVAMFDELQNPRHEGKRFTVGY